MYIASRKNLKGVYFVNYALNSDAAFIERRYSGLSVVGLRNGSDWTVSLQFRKKRINSALIGRD